MAADSVVPGVASGGHATQTERFATMFYPLYQRLFDDDSPLVADLERKLAEARLPQTVELYLSLTLGVGVVGSVACLLFGLLVGYGLFGTGLVEVGTLVGIPVESEALQQLAEAGRLSLFIGVTAFVFAGFGAAVGAGSMLLWPYSQSASRRREINMLLPDAISFMYALSIGGMNQLEILVAMAEAEDTYGEVAREFQAIVQETEYFDTDYRTAIRNQSMATPSDELEEFLMDMLSVINSGGEMTRFLDDKKDKHMRTAKQEQERTLETIELFGEMFMTLSLFPLLLIIVLIVMKMLGDASDLMLYVTVYALIPAVGVGFLVLISTVKRDDPGDGYLRGPGEKAAPTMGQRALWNLGAVEQFAGRHDIFDRIKWSEVSHEAIAVLKRPDHFFRDYPLWTLALTVPLSVVVVVGAVVVGWAPTTWDGLVSAPVTGTFVYVYLPAFLTCIPLAAFHEWNVRSRRAVLRTLSDDLRKLASANATGLTLVQALETVADTSSGRLARELDSIHTKVSYGMTLTDSFREFNNRYHIPRLARTIKLVTKAQETSSHISEVLRTAAQASENRDDIDRDRKSRTRMQVVIITMTYVTLLGVMLILKVQFIDVMAQLGGQAGSGSGGGGGASMFAGGIDTNRFSLMLFHGVTAQAIISGFICGYVREADLTSGVKYVVVFLLAALGGWLFVA